MNLPKLPAKAAHLILNNPSRRNALSLSVLRDLRSQLYKSHTSPVDGQLRLLPPFQPSLLSQFERAQSDPDSPAGKQYGWLVNPTQWHATRANLPSVLVLRSSPGPVFSAGHDLSELHTLSHDEVKETFALCAEVMSLIRRSPAPVIGVIHGLATAAGCQLALSTDLPIAKAATLFKLPGASMGLPCTSPSTAVGRRLGIGFTYRMLALAEGWRADEVPGGVVDVVPESEGEEGLERRVEQVVQRLTAAPAQPQALGKWAYWTQMGFDGTGEGASGGDGYEDAVAWAGGMMAVHARCADAREGMSAFREKRTPEWVT